MPRKTQHHPTRPEHRHAPATGSFVPEQEKHEHKQELLDEGLEESFPASDPPSIVRE